MSTGLTYHAKAEGARRNAKVCLLFADQVGCGLTEAPVVLAQGLARGIVKFCGSPVRA